MLSESVVTDVRQTSKCVFLRDKTIFWNFMKLWGKISKVGTHMNIFQPNCVFFFKRIYTCIII